ncbi:MAG: imidazole glycerol phosphate synthase subunit HisH [Sphingomonadales bacterium]|nr:MAG: imidazole glycerol phosphate synthase subunit HisH [Sphingomonadales bacterium]
MAERVVVIDYGSGNLRSVAKALERVADGTFDIRVSGSAAELAAADRIVLPGVGAFGQCSSALHAIPDMIPALNRAVREQGRPFLGICVGMQLLATRGLEHGEHPGLGWIAGDVVRLSPADPALKVPHIGWNALHPARPHPVLPPPGHAYFVHSYHLAAQNPAHVLATTDYGQDIAAVVGADTFLGTQFHPEKSQALGLELLRNFLEWRP